MRPKIESWNSGNHELWNHEMRGSPVLACKDVSWVVVVSWESEATPSATPFFKRAYKISHPPRFWVSWIDLPSFASSSKILPNFSNKVFFWLKLWKSHLNKKCAPNLSFFNEKKIQKDSDDFWHRKFTLKVQFSHFVPSWQS